MGCIYSLLYKEPNVIVWCYHDLSLCADTLSPSHTPVLSPHSSHLGVVPCGPTSSAQHPTPSAQLPYHAKNSVGQALELTPPSLEIWG